MQKSTFCSGEVGARPADRKRPAGRRTSTFSPIRISAAGSQRLDPPPAGRAKCRQGFRGTTMDQPYDLVVRGGLVHDGLGSAPREADVAVKDGLIAAVGAVAGRGIEEIDARGQLVTPGFVDIHTHYD